jgi:hypothetical protein
MTRSQLSLVAVPVCIAAAALPGQATKVIPPSAAAQDGNAASSYPFTRATNGVFRFQQIIDGAEVCTTDATLTALAFRRDAGNAQTYAAHRFPYVSLIAGHARATAVDMAQQFTQNWGASTTIVFGGPLDLPRQPPVATVGPWNVSIPFSAPFHYRRAQGDLLFELTERNWNAGSGFYDLDAFAVPHGARTTHFGTRGSTSLNEDYVLDVQDVRQLRPGGIAELRFTNFRQPYQAALGLGLSSTRNGSLLLPFDLTGVGAPGNFLYHSWDVPFAVGVRPIGFRGIHEGTLRIAMPDHPGIIGARLFAQGFVLDAAANTLGAVFSDRVDLDLVTATGPFQTIAAFGTITGHYLVSSSVLAGPVLRLSGTFR